MVSLDTSRQYPYKSFYLDSFIRTTPAGHTFSATEPFSGPFLFKRPQNPASVPG